MELNDAVSALGALAHPHRLAVFRHLVTMAPGGVPAGELARLVGMTPTAASFHLKELDRAGLILAERSGRQIRYAADIAGVRGLIGFLIDDCCQGRPDLCGTLLPLQAAADSGCCSGQQVNPERPAVETNHV